MITEPMPSTIIDTLWPNTAMPAIAKSHPKMSEAPIHSKSGTLR